jgi:CheY-like chemotaxis protein
LLAAGIPPAANDTSFLLDHGEGHKIDVRRAGAVSPGLAGSCSSGNDSSPRKAINDGDQVEATSPNLQDEQQEYHLEIGGGPYDVVLTDIQMPVMGKSSAIVKPHSLRLPLRQYTAVSSKLPQ